MADIIRIFGQTRLLGDNETGGKEFRSFGIYAHGVDFDRPYDEYTRHYETLEQAKAGHEEIVKEVKERIRNEKDH